MSYKTCNRCGKEKPATTDYFRKDKACKDGFRGQCKDCIKEYNKQHRKENKEHYREYSKQWHQENKEYIKEYKKEYNKQYRKENKEYYREYNKQYSKENKEYIKEYKKQWHQENEEYVKEYRKQYLQENIDRYRRYNQKRRAVEKRLPHTLTLDQWEQIKVDFNNKCAYCGMTEEEHRKRFNEQLHQEHFIPLSEGGEYTHNNIIPACRSCNASKRDTDFFEWYPTYEEYNEEREQFILEYLGYIEDTQQLTLESTFTEIQKAPTMR